MSSPVAFLGIEISLRPMPQYFRGSHSLLAGTCFCLAMGRQNNFSSQEYPFSLKNLTLVIFPKEINSLHELHITFANSVLLETKRG
jgi:hypothetical protein